MDIATTLLEYGAKANAESKAGFTPLHLSAQEGHTDMSTLLIEHKADTNHKAKVSYEHPIDIASYLHNELLVSFSERPHAVASMRPRRQSQRGFYPR